jgi:hypothetical protein
MTPKPVGESAPKDSVSQGSCACTISRARCNTRSLHRLGGDGGGQGWTGSPSINGHLIAGFCFVM